MKDQTVRDELAETKETIEKWSHELADAINDELRRVNLDVSDLTEAFKSSEARQRMLDRIVRGRIDLIEGRLNEVIRLLTASNEAHAERFAEVEARLDEVEEEGTEVAFPQAESPIPGLLDSLFLTVNVAPPKAEEAEEEVLTEVLTEVHAGSLFSSTPQGEYVRTGEYRKAEPGEYVIRKTNGTVQRVFAAHRATQTAYEIVVPKERAESSLVGADGSDTSPLNDSPWFTDPDAYGADHDDRLYEAQQKQAPVSFVYERESDGKREVRVLSPWELSDDAWYLADASGSAEAEGSVLGFDHVRGAIRRFNLANIRSEVVPAYGVAYRPPQD